MDFNMWLGALSIVITIVFGVLSIYLFKSKRYPGAMTFIQEQSIGLFDSLIKNFSQIAITYENQAINQQIVLLKGYLINTGSIDIKEEMVADDLALILPANFTFLNAKVVDQSNGNKTSVSISSGNIMVFNLGLFRKNEFIRFEALVDVPSNDDSKKNSSQILSEKIEFNHRIADTNKIEKKNLDLKPPQLFTKKNTIKFIYPLVALVYLIALILLSSKIDTKDFGEMQYRIKGPKNKILNVTARARVDNTIKLETLDGTFYKNVPVADFYKNYFIDAKSTDLRSEGIIGLIVGNSLYVIFVMVIALFILSGIPALSLFNEHRKIKRLRATLNLADN